MGKRGVKPGEKRGPYKRKDKLSLSEAKKHRQEQAEILLPQFLAVEWKKDWRSSEMLQKLFLLAFSGLSHVDSAKMLGVSESELLRALQAFPEAKGHWDRGQEEVVTLCHIALTQRIRGMKVTEIRRTEKADGGIDTTTITKELPPDIDAVKYFLSNRVSQYKPTDAASAFEGRLDTMLGRIEQMDLFNQ